MIMDYIWKKNWQGRHYMDVHVSSFYKELMAEKIKAAELQNPERQRLNILRDIMWGFKQIDKEPPTEIMEEYNEVARKASIYDVLQRQLLELELHTREQEKNLGMRKRNRWGISYYNKTDC